MQKDDNKKIEITLLEAATLLCKGRSLADLSNIDNEHMEALYALGYQHYNAQNYTDALNIFKALCVYDSTQSKYFMGMGATLQELSQYKLAAETYAMACAVDGLIDPEPMYFAAVCLLKCNEKENAIAALESTSIMGRNDNKKDSVFKEKCKNLLVAIKKS